MNSISRYFLKSSQWQTGQLTLTGDEAHHCTRVLRSKLGETVEVFDGEGKSAQGEIISLGKDKVEITLKNEPIFSNRPNEIHLIQAIPKGGNMELIVQKAVELGITSIQPLITEHTIVRSEQMDKKLAKWQRIALEACKQCGQNYLPTILPVEKFSNWIETEQQADLNIVAALLPTSLPLAEIFTAKPKSSSCLIGPEGDFSDNEYQQIIDADYQPVTLGDIVLRVETATLYCLSVIKHELARL
ncbi:MAG: 16S rRNA (uracil1498-N3)-methyltransferase [Cryomorphaceae bacterium]|jgi:16S rRNA (uracil1498-N3)-methyltransferase